ncbi:MFS transporter [Rhodococcus hoagii]|nr:MFS transporter [Prescottella equi]
MPEHETPTRQLLSPVAERPPVPPSLTGFSNRVIAILAICGTVMTLQQTMILPVLPALPGLLGVSAGSASWLVTATLVTGAVVTPLIGRLADMFGKKRMIMLTLVVVVVGSAMGGLFTALPPSSSPASCRAAGWPWFPWRSRRCETCYQRNASPGACPRWAPRWRSARRPASPWRVYSSTTWIGAGSSG